MKFGSIVVLILAIWIGAAFTASAEDVTEYKMSLVVGPRGPWGEGAQRFIDTIGARSGGKIKIKPYYAGKLLAGKEINEFELLKSGQADFALGSAVNWSPKVEALNLFSLPFFFPNYKSLDAVTDG